MKHGISKLKIKQIQILIYLRSDNGTEFTSNNFKEICNKYRITQQFTVPGNPQQNGRAERLNGVLIQIATAMLIDSQLCRRFWEDALTTANYVHHRVPHHGNNKKIPFEVFYEKKVDNSNLHVFDCKVYYYEVNPEKFRSNSRKGIFLGYDEDSYGSCRSNKRITSYGHRYILSILDDFLRYWWVFFFLLNKRDHYNKFHNWFYRNQQYK